MRTCNDFINPTPFSLNQGIEYLFMAVVGGAGSVWGALLGALSITALKELLQVGLRGLTGQSGPYELIVFGILVIVLLQRSRDGLWPLVRCPVAGSGYTGGDGSIRIAQQINNASDGASSGQHFAKE